MKSSFIEIHCNEKMKNIICSSLRNFACIAYPKNPNSECNLVASDALINAADTFEKNFCESGTGVINRRMRKLLQTAIESHYKILSELENVSKAHQCELMLKVCKGEIINNEALVEAEKLDQQS